MYRSKYTYKLCLEPNVVCSTPIPPRLPSLFWQYNMVTGYIKNIFVDCFYLIINKCFIFVPVNSKFGPTVEWHNDLSEVPRRCFSIFLTNEFFDAMPVHKFVRVNSDESAGSKVWREVLVDIEDDKNGETKLRFVRSRNKTPGNFDFNRFYLIFYGMLRTQELVGQS